MNYIIYLFLLTLTSSLFAIQEGTYIQYEDAEKQIQSNIQDNYTYPLLDEIKAPTKKQELSLQQKVIDYFGTFVTSSPYPGVRATFEGSELMSQLSSVNKDLQLLLELQKSLIYMQKKNVPYPEHPRVFISGQIDTTGFIGQSTSDIQLSGAELDFLIAIAPWIYGFMAFEYDDSVNSLLSQNPIQNSKIYANSVFITLGDLTYSPWYLTIGQTYIPFGQYSTFNAINPPLTRALFRIIARDVAMGYYDETIQFSAFAFKGPSHANQSGNHINNYGVNLGYHFLFKKLDGKVSLGLIRNIADSIGIQGAFGDPSNSEKLRYVVPGINANGNFSIGKWTFLVEFNQAMRPFSWRDTSYSKNGTVFFGPCPKAFDLELAYDFSIYQKPSSIGFSYSKSYQALAFNVPRERIALSSATHVFPGCLLSFELSTNKLYNSSNRVAGVMTTGNPYYMNPENLGSRDLFFGIDFLIYF